MAQDSKAETIEVGDWVDHKYIDLDARQVAKIKGDNIWLYMLSDKPQGPFLLDNYKVSSKKSRHS